MCRIIHPDENPTRYGLLIIRNAEPVPTLIRNLRNRLRQITEELYGERRNTTVATNFEIILGAVITVTIFSFLIFILMLTILILT